MTGQPSGEGGQISFRGGAGPPGPSLAPALSDKQEYILRCSWNCCVR